MGNGRNRSSALTAILAVSIIAVACGGGEPSKSPTPTGPSLPLVASPTATAVAPTATPPPTTTPTPKPAVTPAAPTPATAGVQPKYGGILQARLQSERPNLDTYHPSGFSAAYMVMQTLSNLVNFKGVSLSEIEGDVAKNWEVGGDGKAFTFRLREDIQWSDGKPFTSADVLYNFRRASDPMATYNKGRVDVISTMETPDSYTFRATLMRFSASFLYGTASATMLMYPAHIPDKAEWTKSQVGTGPFVLKLHNQGSLYSYRKNAKYYGRDAAARSLPYLDGIDFNIIPDIALSLAAFRTGRIDCGCFSDRDFLTENEEALRQENPQMKFTQLSSTKQSLQFNLQAPPFNNLALRQAVAIGLDKEQIGTVFLGGKTLRPCLP